MTYPRPAPSLQLRGSPQRRSRASHFKDGFMSYYIIAYYISYIYIYIYLLLLLSLLLLYIYIYICIHYYMILYYLLLYCIIWYDIILCYFIIHYIIRSILCYITRIMGRAWADGRRATTWAAADRRINIFQLYSSNPTTTTTAEG